MIKVGAGPDSGKGGTALGGGGGGILFAAQDKERDEEEEHEEDTEGGSEGLIAGAGELILNDFTDGGGWNRLPLVW